MDFILVVNMNLIGEMESEGAGLKHMDSLRGSGSHNPRTVKDEFTDSDQLNMTEETPSSEEHPAADTEMRETK